MRSTFLLSFFWIISLYLQQLLRVLLSLLFSFAPLVFSCCLPPYCRDVVSLGRGLSASRTQQHCRLATAMSANPPHLLSLVSGNSGDEMMERHAVQKEREASSSHVRRLPLEILQLIFIEVIKSDNFNFAWVGVLSSVCLQWHFACQHPVMWRFVVKSVFVAYPLLRRMGGVSDNMRGSGHYLAFGPGNSAVYGDAASPATALTSQFLRQIIEDVRSYDERRSYHEYVRHRRVFVVGMMLSCALFIFSLFLFVTICVLEGIDFGGICTPHLSLTLLWTMYFVVFVLIISNIVMETHFEPQPLLPRLQKNKPLIVTSTAVLVIGVFTLALPTLLVHINLMRVTKFNWAWCGVTPFVFFLLWQSYVVFCHILRGVPRAEPAGRWWWCARPADVVLFVLSIPYAFPLCCAVSLYSLSQYVEYGGRVSLLVGVLPLLVSLPVLSMLLLLDFYMKSRTKDLLTGLSLAIASLFPVSLLWTDFRGYSLLPVAIASTLIFVTHLQLVAVRSFRELIEGARRCGRSSRRIVPVRVVSPW
uniref:F-box domain-containing protein n=1 Tax=Trypanosoma congolense (strain IL3000) TaxID=1068625 RepID=G0UV54_TRYCI|nr:conserved hypothetical protein [Trypanosoma congolense IL3000]